MMNNQQGFTLLEIILVIAAIGILAAIVIVAINPTRQLQSARNVSREADTEKLFDVLNSYFIENGEALPTIQAMANDTSAEICLDGVDQSTCESGGYIYLGSLTPEYMSSIPTDPDQVGNGSGYELHKSTNSRLGIRALHVEGDVDPIEAGTMVSP